MSCLGLVVVWATDSNACRREGGNSRSRAAARRRIPAAALGLKKYLGGTGRVSKTSDNEHTAAALGHSEVLSVKHPPDHAVPEFDQATDDDSEVTSSVAG